MHKTYIRFLFKTQNLSLFLNLGSIEGTPMALVTIWRILSGVLPKFPS